jgi:hypothetical protein
MSGVVLLREIQSGAAPSGGGPSGATWNDIYGLNYGQSNSVTMAGLTGPLTISLSHTGMGIINYVLNGAVFAYGHFGPFTVNNGDMVGFGVAAPSVAASGTLTIMDATHSVVLQTLSYVISA